MGPQRSSKLQKQKTNMRPPNMRGPHYGAPSCFMRLACVHSKKISFRDRSLMIHEGGGPKMGAPGAPIFGAPNSDK